MDFNSASEKSSDYVKRVLFGGSSTTRPAAIASTRSESHSSTSSTPGSTVFGVPSTPRIATAGVGVLGRNTPASKAPTSTNAAVSVFLRVRPPGTPGADVDKRSGRRTYQILEDQATLRTFPPLSSGHSRTINRQAKDFGFTRVLSAKATQEETYESTMRLLVDDVFAARNALLFAYGMTNAGKTYTVLGEEGSPGLIPQALTDTFERVASIKNGSEEGPQVRVEMSFLEIYNENVFDLLAASSPDDWANARTALKLDDRMGVIQARDLSKHQICSASEGIDLVKRATANRMVASTKLNEDSSRSHSVCMIKLNRDKARDSNLWVVDLAGSERSGRTGVGASSARQKEANNINKSLSTLWHCLTIMRSNLRKDEPETRVPFRESKLTHLFKNHLQLGEVRVPRRRGTVGVGHASISCEYGVAKQSVYVLLVVLWPLECSIRKAFDRGPAAGKTVMVVNINPSIEDFDETQQVLKNSTIAREVKTVKDASAANRQNGLINTHYGFNGRKMQVKKPAASRRSIHQAVAPKLENLGPPPPKTPTQSPVRLDGSPSDGRDTDCASAAGEGNRGGDDIEDVEDVEDEADDNDGRQRDDGYLSGAESDSGLVDTRQSMNLVVKNLQIDNEVLQSRLKATLAAKTKKMHDGHQPIPGGPVERYIALLEDKVNAAEDQLEQMCKDHRLEIEELEQEFDSFIQENNLNGDSKGADLVSRLQEEARVAKQQADHFEKEAETLRARLEVIESRMSPLRESLDSTKNRQDEENSPPVTMKTGPAPGGVGSPSKNAHRHTSSSPKTKASALPTKKKTSSVATKLQISSNGATSSPVALNNGVTGSSIEKEVVVSTSSTVEASVTNEACTVSVSKGHAPCDAGGTCEAAHDERKQAKVVIAVSRRVSVLRVSNAGTGRVSNVRPSLAGGRRKSRASHAAAGGRRVSQLRAGFSGGLAQNHAAAPPHGTASANASKTTYQDPHDVTCCPGGGGSRRESSMIMEEDNFLEKARRCMLRAIGLSSRKSILASESGGGSFRAGRTVPETAEEIEAKQKIKVKMPPRPNKKAMEGTGGAADPFWVAEQQSDEIVEEEDRSPRKSSSNVVNGIERWVFGSKAERPTPKAKRTPGATADSSPVPSQGSAAKTIHDYMRAM